MSKDVPVPQHFEVRAETRVAIVAARFNAELVAELLTGCRRRLVEAGLSNDRIEVYRVPGAFELPVTATVLAETTRVSAVICLGCVIRGDTPHFDYVAGEAARGIARVSLDHSLPVIFGVLTTNTEQQAWDRAGGSHGHAGERAAEAALEMIGVLRAIRAG
jgi:6,7-dimethyl-8-ribityllumazine synthase